MDKELICPLGTWKSPNELPTQNDGAEPITCLVIVKGEQSGNIRIEETEYRYGEWDISNAWTLLAWNNRAEQPNEPLTLDELNQMKGKPVWFTDKNGSIGVWGIVGIFNSRKLFIRTAYDTMGHEDDYNKTWLAFRRKPIEKE